MILCTDSAVDQRLAVMNRGFEKIKLEALLVPAHSVIESIERFEILRVVSDGMTMIAVKGPHLLVGGNLVALRCLN